MYKKRLLYALLILSSNVFSQMKVGSNPKIISTNTYFEVESTNSTKIVVTKDSGRVGIGIIKPTQALHIKSNIEPLRLEGLQIGAASDSLLTVNDSGVVRRIRMNTISSGGGGSWNNVATTNAATSNTQDIYQMGKVGIGTTTPSNSAILELVATDKALLLPRVANTAAIATPVNGMMIYDNASNCIKGFENGAWTNCYSSGGPSASVVQDCNANGLEGNYFNGQALSGTRYTVRITNNSFSSATIAFAASDLVLTGVLGMTVGTPTGTPALTSGSITLVAGQSVVVSYPITGTPTSQGTLTARWTKLALNCTRTLAVVNAPPAFNCNAVSITSNRFNLIKDSTYSGTISIPYTVVGGGEAFPAETITSNGLTFTRNAGTYSAPSGTIPYTFSGTYTGTTNSVFTINTDNNAGACPVVIFDAIRAALAQGGCTSCAVYDAAAINAPVQITKAEYDRIALISGASKSGLADATIATNSPNPQAFAGNTTFTSNNLENTQIPVSNFIMAFQVRTSATTISTMAGIQLKTGTVHNGPYTNYGSVTTATSSNLASTNYFFVFKRPTATTASGSNSFFAFYIAAIGQIQVFPSFNGVFYSLSGNVNSFSSAGTSGQRTYAQFLSTPTKQW